MGPSLPIIKTSSKSLELPFSLNPHAPQQRGTNKTTTV
ncbi:hypothetical protein Nizo2877_2227 [Lactiplantibacillus plantarum]|nr:hypothetical protein Nizo2877_2227 [Lactiplantibacillus plantarum]KZU70108.1 hypothetical protein Nizo2855_2955 [Lactiplantibacillus plantarum]